MPPAPDPTLNLREAKARLSAVVSAAEQGRSTTITKHGKAVAVVVPIANAQGGVAEAPAAYKPSFAEHLMAIPCEIEFERDRTPWKPVEF